MPSKIYTETSVGHVRISFLFLLALAVVLSAANADAVLAVVPNPAYAGPEEASLPASSMRIEPQRVALVVIDPQNDFLHEKGDRKSTRLNSSHYS